MTHIYRFNRPISLLFLLPMVFLIVMLTAGLLREFSVLAFVLVLISLAVVGMVLYFSLLRSLSVGEQGLRWKAPGTEMEMSWAEVRHYGIVKYRSFRFIYLARSESVPFEQANARIVTSEDVFVVQYRERAWKQIKGLIQEKNPGLEPVFMERGR